MRSLEITLKVEKLLPSHEFKVISDNFQNQKKIRGIYRDNEWVFQAELNSQDTKLTLFFELDQVKLSKPLQQDIDTQSEELVIHFNESDLEIEEPSERYIHGINNLLTEESYFSSSYIKSSYDESIVYDAIVVGSGMGGGILADALSDKGMKTLVLEVGTIHHPLNVTNLPTPNNVFESQTYKNIEGSQLDKDVCLNLGGRSVYWSALIPRMNDWEIQFWPDDIAEYLDTEGYSKAEKLFRKRTEYNQFQERLLGLIESSFTDHYVSHLPRSFHQHMSRITGRDGSPDERPTGTFSTAALLLNSMSEPGRAGNENLRINLNHLVTKILAEGNEVKGVECQDLVAHKTRVYKARNIILCAGATESPIIFLKSDLKDSSNKVGIGLTDHQSAWLNFEIPSNSPYFTENDQAKFFLKPKIFDFQQGAYSCELALNWKFWDVRYEDDDLFLDKAAQDVPIRSTIKFLFRRGLNEDNFIRVSNPLNEVYVAPMLDHPFEKEINCLKNEVLEFFGVNDPRLYEQSVKYRSRSETYHTGGSLRIGEHGYGVVDSTLRFHEYTNLFCCDLSVFPDIPTANPSLTLGALALRLAENIQ